MGSLSSIQYPFPSECILREARNNLNLSQGIMNNIQGRHSEVHHGDITGTYWDAFIKDRYY